MSDACEFALKEKSPKTVNNALTCLSKLLKVAVQWREITHMPCTIRLLKTGEGSMQSWDRGAAWRRCRTA